MKVNSFPEVDSRLAFLGFAVLLRVAWAATP